MSPSLFERATDTASDDDLAIDLDEEVDPGDTPDRYESVNDRPWSWHAIRVSGLFLAVLIPIHFCVTIIGGDVGATTAATMFNRLRNTWWRGFEWIVLGLALVHAVLSIHAAIGRSDLAPLPQRRLAVATTAVGSALAAVAAWFLITYR